MRWVLGNQTKSEVPLGGRSSSACGQRSCASRSGHATGLRATWPGRSSQSVLSKTRGAADCGWLIRGVPVGSWCNDSDDLLELAHMGKALTYTETTRTNPRISQSTSEVLEKCEHLRFSYLFSYILCFFVKIVEFVFSCTFYVFDAFPT